MTATYEKIATTTLGSTASDITFSSITGSYTDLVLIENGKVSAGGGSYSRIRFNSDTGSNYSATYIYGNGTAAGSDRYSNQTFIPVNYVAAIETNFNHNSIINIQNYSNSTTYKTVLARSNNAATATDAAVALWRSTSAITSITYYLNSGSWATGSTFTLYGIKAE
jgi:hypothetical protein